MQKYSDVFNNNDLNAYCSSYDASITIHNGEAHSDLIGLSFGKDGWLRNPKGEKVSWIKTIDGIKLELYAMESFDLVPVPVNAWPIMLTNNVL